MSSPQTPRALAIRVAELETQMNAAHKHHQEQNQRILELIAENTQLRQLLGEAKDEVDQLQHQYDTERRKYELVQRDHWRFAWWFHNGHNVDEQLFELNRRRALDPKSVTLDMWRTAIDAAMEKKR